VHRRMRMMNSQLEALTPGTDDEIGVRVHPDLAAAVGGEGAPVTVHTDHGSVTGRIVIDARLRSDTVTIGHGSESCDVSRLTSGVSGIDPLTGMVEQSGLRCRLRPDP
ncbi:MAG: molybdopterin dinucleotide binding domain-containing protein, partial [Acidimicrobiia bacterium]